MDCAAIFVKYLVFFINLIFAILGVAVLAISGVVLWGVKSLKEDTGFGPFIIFVLLIGAIVFLISFCGCCGAVSENTCMLNSYSIFLILLMLCKVVIGIIILTHKTQASEAVEKAVDFSFQYYGNTTDVQELFNETQKDLHCCGSTGPDSYNQHNFTLPTSCCPSPKNQKPPCSTAEAYQKGCGKEVASIFVQNIQHIAMLIFALAAVELFATIISLYLSSEVKAGRTAGSAYGRF